MYVLYRNMVIFHGHLSFHGFFSMPFQWIRRIFSNPAQVSIANVTAGSKLHLGLLLSFPIASMGLVYLPIHLFDVYGKYKQIYHTWMLWVFSGLCWLLVLSISHLKITQKRPFFGGQYVVRVFFEEPASCERPPFFQKIGITTVSGRKFYGNQVRKNLRKVILEHPICRWFRSRRWIPPQLVFEIQPPLIWGEGKSLTQKCRRV